MSHVTGPYDLSKMSHLSCVTWPLYKSTSRHFHQIRQLRVQFSSRCQVGPCHPPFGRCTKLKFCTSGHRSHPCENWMKWDSTPPNCHQVTETWIKWCSHTQLQYHINLLTAGCLVNFTLNTAWHQGHLSQICWGWVVIQGRLVYWAGYELLGFTCHFHRFIHPHLHFNSRA